MLLTATSVIAFLPTYRKGFSRPTEERVSTYFLSGLKFVVALFALNAFIPTNYLYPIVMLSTNWGFVILLWSRRKRAL
jgi:hypothetical protein